MMKRAVLAVLVLGGMCGVSSFANTYVVGMKNELPGTTIEGIGDFNDLIISLSGSLTFQSLDSGASGAFSSAIVNESQTYPTTNANPFWDNVSQDDATHGGMPMNIGYCLTTNNCGLGGSSGAPVDGVNTFFYGSAGQGTPDNSFGFNATGSFVTLNLASISGAMTNGESLGWYQLGSPGVGGVIIPIGSAGTAGTYNFSPTANFGLWFYANGTYFYTENGFDSVTSSASRFAVFGVTAPNGVPEPGTMALFGLGALVLGMIPRLRKRRG